MRNEKYSMFIAGQILETLKSKTIPVKDQFDNPTVISYAQKRISYLEDMLAHENPDLSCFFSSANNLMAFFEDDHFMLRDLQAEAQRLSYES